MFQHAFELANRANMTIKELEAYDASITVMLDERGRIEGALEIGEKMGVLRVALAMRKNGMESGLSAQLTGLAAKEVEALS